LTGKRAVKNEEKRVLPAITTVHKYCYGSEPELPVLRFIEVQVQVRYEILKSFTSQIMIFVRTILGT
jgi:hypothetical protein